MNDRPPVVLIGPMGAGKTRMGKRIARRLGTGFTDTDAVIVAEHGPIAAIFAEHGEPYFRSLERAAVAHALTGGDVVALGGGAVLDPQTRAELAGHRIALLTVSPEAVAPRLDGGKRPLIADGIEDWKRIYAERQAVYEELAGARFDTSFRRADDVVEEVVAWATT